MPLTLRGKISNITPLTLDKTLTLEGASADAKAVGDAIKEAKQTANQETAEHANNKSNPHQVTAEQIGLGNCDNTSDMDKPVSFAQETAISDAKRIGTLAQEAAEEAQQAAENAQTAAVNAEKNAKEHADTVAGDAEKNAKDYADGLHKPFTVEVPASGWSASAPFTQTIAVEGVLETDRPHWGVVYSDDTESALAEKEAFAVVDKLNTADGSVTFTCLEEKPEADLTIQMEVNR